MLRGHIFILITSLIFILSGLFYINIYDKKDEIHEGLVNQKLWTKISPFQIQANNPHLFDGDLMALASGKIKENKAVAVSWGSLGMLWGKPVVTVYIEKNRKTHEFMKNNEYFTVTAFPDYFQKMLVNIGSQTIENEEKIKNLGFKLGFTELGHPAFFEQGKLVIECKKVYESPFKTEGFGELADMMYENRELHTIYIGEIVNIWKKNNSDIKL